MAIDIRCADAAQSEGRADLIITDPPFDLPGDHLARILDRYQAPHLVLVTSMRQLMQLMQASDWELAFDFVLDAVQPKESKASHQPHYTHQTGVYLRRPGVRSAFDRKQRQRSDVFEANGYWPTVIRAPRERAGQHGHAKNAQAWTDILGSFRVQSVMDPFAGSFTTAMAAAELDLDCLAIDRDPVHCARAKKALRFCGVEVM
jgi:hypothetical protein